MAKFRSKAKVVEAMKYEGDLAAVVEWARGLDDRPTVQLKVSFLRDRTHLYLGNEGKAWTTVDIGAWLVHGDEKLLIWSDEYMNSAYEAM